MSTAIRSALRTAAYRILRPLVRILLRNGVACDEFFEWVKRVYVEVAMQEFGLPGRQPTVSRTAVVTGLTRKEVQRLLAINDQEQRDPHVNRAAKVVAGWVRDKEFHDSRGEPRALPFAGESSFTELVRRYSGDMPPRAVLDELLRVGVVEHTAGGLSMLRARSYVPALDDLSKLHILGTDVAALLTTIDHNLQPAGQAPRYQRKVRYDNIPLQELEALRSVAAARCQQLLEELDVLFASHDRDANPALTGDGRGVAGVGIYYFEEPAPGPDSEVGK